MNILLGLILAFIVFLMANGLYKLLNRPKVIKIDKSARPNRALLVIDMQEDFTRADGRFAHEPEARDSAIAAINAASAKAHEAGIPVVEVSHAFVDPIEKFGIKLMNRGRGIEGSDGLGRDRDLTFHANQHIWKHEGDSFSAPMLVRFLDDHQIGHLFVAGQEANACIAATARGALAREFDLTLLEDGILARNSEKWERQKTALIEKGARLSNLSGFSDE